MYERVACITPDERDALLNKIIEWKHKTGEKTDYWVHVLDGQRMFVKLEPGGHIHSHVDDAPPKTHVVLQTNKLALSRSGTTCYTLEEMGVYSMDPKIEHEAWNYGNTDRIHYILS